MKTLYNGKTKTVMLDEATGVVNLFFKDSATGENGVFDPGSNTVGGSVEGKGKIGLKISKHFFEIMEKNGHSHPLSGRGCGAGPDAGAQADRAEAGVCAALLHGWLYVPPV